MPQSGVRDGAGRKECPREEQRVVRGVRAQQGGGGHPPGSRGPTWSVGVQARRRGGPHERAGGGRGERVVTYRGTPSNKYIY